MDSPQKYAENVYHYYFELAKKEFDIPTALKLAQIPADYVYNALNSKKCVNPECCLDYCYERLDSEFNRLDPEVKRKEYNRLTGVESNISDYSINNYLKARRRKLSNDLYHSRARSIKKSNEDSFMDMFENMSIKRKAIDDDLLDSLSNISLKKNK